MMREHKKLWYASEGTAGHCGSRKPRCRVRKASSRVPPERMNTDWDPIREDGEGLTRLPALIQQGRTDRPRRVVGARAYQAEATAGLTRGFDLTGNDLPMAVGTSRGGAHVRAVQGDRKVRTGWTGRRGWFLRRWRGDRFL